MSTNRTTTPDRPQSRGFTLAELLVAVSVVIVLSLAIGQVFSSVGRLVGAGAALSELDQSARAIERQLRDDFAAISRMKSSETFFAIRSRTLGDANNDGAITPPAGVNNTQGEIAVYLNQEDKDEDTRAARTNPYDRDANGNQVARGVTVRLDEMVFLAQASEKGPYTSFQRAGAEGQPVTSNFARIYYGQGLLPARPRTPSGQAFDPTAGANSTNRPVRRLAPDTFRAAIPTDPDNDAADTALQGTFPWALAFAEPQTRNEFASDWPLLRQQVLLWGGRAAGNALDSAGTLRSPINGVNALRSYAATLRDRENYNRVPESDAGRIGNGWLYPQNTLSSARLFRWGRTDICAQDRDDVQRWLEGLETSAVLPITSATYSPADATAFTAGALDRPFRTSDSSPIFWNLPNTWHDASLFFRCAEEWGLPAGPYSGSEALALFDAQRRLRSAVAGVFTRVLCDPEPADPSRLSALAGVNLTAAGSTIADPFPGDASMDQHALLATRCSSLEIAWSDGTTWTDATPLKVYLGSTSNPNDLVAQYNSGDLVWFDSVFTRRHFLALGVEGTGSTSGNFLDAAPEPEVLPDLADTYYARTVHPSYGSTFSSNGDDRRGDDLRRLMNIDPANLAGGADAGYDFKSSGGSEREYLAVWGFRRPTIESTGATSKRMGWSTAAWEKPKYVRVRMTLHDSQNRIKEGKRYEFVLSIRQPTE